MNENYHKQFEDLLIKYLLQEADPQEIRSVEEWLSADPANRRYYDQIRLIWEKSLLSQPGLPQIEGEEENAWLILQKKLRQPASHTSAPVFRKLMPAFSKPIPAIRWAAVAALLLPIALIGFLWWHNTTSANWQRTESHGLVRTDTLPDGSIVTLNKHSSLSRPQTFKGDRPVRLEGEAFFRIAPDKSRPFRVEAGGITVTVLGTSFNVRFQNGKTEISVETGLVSVSNKHGHLQLGPGEQTALDKDDPTLTRHAAGPALNHYYRPRDFVCDDTPLWQLVDALNEAYQVHITIANDSLRNKPINTTFHNEDLDRILAVISETLGARTIKTASGTILK